LVSDNDFQKFDHAIEAGLKLRDSLLAEILLVVLAYALTATTLASTALHASTWYALRVETGVSLTWAGWWFALFCVPLFQFLTLRWLWRLFLWGQFLWRMNRLNLQLIPTHPDQADGLAFVGESQRFFGIVLLAYSIAVAGVLANGILYDKFPLPHFAPAIAAYIAIAVILVLIPLCIFSGVLWRTKKLGLSQYGTLATAYTSSFHLKWIVEPRETKDPLLGTADIQSLADLGNSYALVDKMNLLPMSSRTPIHLALACLIPMAPLLLTMMPLREVIKMIVKVVL